MCLRPGPLEAPQALLVHPMKAGAITFTGTFKELILGFTAHKDFGFSSGVFNLTGFSVQTAQVAFISRTVCNQIWQRLWTPARNLTNGLAGPPYSAWSLRGRSPAAANVAGATQSGLQFAAVFSPVTSFLKTASVVEGRHIFSRHGNSTDLGPF